MEGTSQNKHESSLAVELGKMLSLHNCADVVVMDMKPLDFWTDFFVIATATSNTHMMGLERHIKDFIQENGLEILRRSRKSVNVREAELHPDEWRLFDLGNMVVHLMTAKVRSFFELERLWSAAPLIYQTESSQGHGALKASSHSSKSS